MTKFIVTHEQVTGSDIREIVRELEELTDGKPRTPTIVALLSLALFYQNPDMTEDELIDAVRLVSRYTATVATGVGDGRVN